MTHKTDQGFNYETTPRHLRITDYRNYSDSCYANQSQEIKTDKPTKALTEMYTHSLSVIQIATKYKVSRFSVYRWIDLYGEEVKTQIGRSILK